ncbi:DUF4082 domain-containing protein [Actinoplanes sp. NPDC051851]|uniref:DUF4082 domain-containing protein n=1 Tax=Actinoplanes sp. NPDC051851 TaxID=3154753 RepID=UPI003443C570
MAVEYLTWPNEPTLTNGYDGSNSYSMGIKFTLTAASACPGVRWRVPDSLESPAGGTHVVSVWDRLTETRLAYKEFTPVAGGYQNILFDTPLSLSAGTEYVASVHTVHYVYSAPTPTSGWTLQSPSGVLQATESKLAISDSGPATYPSGSYSAWYYVSPLIGSDSTSAVPAGIAVPATAGSPVAVLTGAAPSGIAAATAVGAPTAALGLTAVPAGIPLAAMPGSPASSLPGSAPAGIAVTVAAGTPAMGATGATPAGIAVAVVLGAPRVDLVLTAAPAGIAVMVVAGAPGAGSPGTVPTGISVPVAAGAPVATLARAAAPSGVAVRIALGTPAIAAPGRLITVRPNSGTTIRPSRGTTARP